MTQSDAEHRARAYSESMTVHRQPPPIVEVRSAYRRDPRHPADTPAAVVAVLLLFFAVGCGVALWLAFRP